MSERNASRTEMCWVLVNPPSVPLTNTQHISVQAEAA